MKIKLPSETRCFERVGGEALCRTNIILGRDAEVTIGQIVSLHYDHRDQEAVAFQLNGKEYYFLVHEIRIAGLADKLRRLANFTVVK